MIRQETTKNPQALRYAGFWSAVVRHETVIWCPGSDSNRHVLLRRILNPLLLQTTIHIAKAVDIWWTQKQ